MVVGTLQHVPSKGRISIMKIQNFTVQKRHSVIKLSYGILCILISIILLSINPIQIITNSVLQMKEGSFLYKMWEKPSYELFNDIWVFNYTNVEEYLSGAEKVLRLKDIGPFTYKEVRTNEYMQVDKEQNLLRMVPKIQLELIRELSVDDPENVTITVPNLALLALSTLGADKLGYFANKGAYYSMSLLAPKVFKTLSAQEVFWGYHDPLVSIANGLLPGWIDFKKLGLLDRIYAHRNESVSLHIDDSKKFSLYTYQNSFGLKEQGYTDWNTSTLCNRIKGTYEGLMLTPNFEKGRNFTLFRKQACRTLPFTFKEEQISEYGFNSYKYVLDNNAFSKNSPYHCDCTDDCVPDGFIDISSCYYGFPITLSKPHYLDVDPVHQAYFEGMNPSVEKGNSYYISEPTIGVPLKYEIKIQINMAVRMSSANPITAPVKDKILPLFWMKLYCNSPPQDIISLLKLRLVIGPPLFITIVVLIFTAGLVLSGLGFYRVWKPKYKIIPPAEPLASIIRRKSLERRRSSVHENMAFKEDDEMAKEAISLLAINEEDNDFVELIISDDNELELE